MVARQNLGETHLFLRKIGGAVRPIFRYHLSRPSSQRLPSVEPLHPAGRAIFNVVPGLCRRRLHHLLRVRDEDRVQEGGAPVLARRCSELGQGARCRVHDFGGSRCILVQQRRTRGPDEPRAAIPVTTYSTIRARPELVFTVLEYLDVDYEPYHFRRSRVEGRARAADPLGVSFSGCSISIWRTNFASRLRKRTPVSHIVAEMLIDPEHPWRHSRVRVTGLLPSVLYSEDPSGPGVLVQVLPQPPRGRWNAAHMTSSFCTRRRARLPFVETEDDAPVRRTFAVSRSHIETPPSPGDGT